MSPWQASPWWLAAALVPYAASQLAFLAALRRVPSRLGWEPARSAAWARYARRRAAGALAGGVFWLCATAALASRADGKGSESGSAGSGLVTIAIDASNSMLIGRPGSRPLDEALRFASGIADAASGARLSLVAFRGGAVTLCPPTADRRAFDDALRWVGPGVTSSAGSDFGAAVREAVRPAIPGGASRLVVVLGDGNDTGGSAREAAAWAARAGAELAFVGFGPDAPMPVSAPGGKPVLDSEGRRVSTMRLDEAMRDWAEAARGAYVGFQDPGAFTAVARMCAAAASSGTGSAVGSGDGVPWSLSALALASLGLALALGFAPRAKSGPTTRRSGSFSGSHRA